MFDTQMQRNDPLSNNVQTINLKMIYHVAHMTLKNLDESAHVIYCQRWVKESGTPFTTMD